MDDVDEERTTSKTITACSGNVVVAEQEDVGDDDHLDADDDDAMMTVMVMVMEDYLKKNLAVPSCPVSDSDGMLLGWVDNVKSPSPKKLPHCAGSTKPP